MIYTKRNNREKLNQRKIKRGDKQENEEAKITTVIELTNWKVLGSLNENSSIKLIENKNENKSAAEEKANIKTRTKIVKDIETITKEFDTAMKHKVNLFKHKTNNKINQKGYRINTEPARHNPIEKSSQVKKFQKNEALTTGNNP